MRRGRSRAPWWFRPAASLIVLLVFLSLGEGVARMIGPLTPTWQGNDPGGVIMVGHPTRLWGMGPGKRQNAGAMATISALGLREPVPTEPRPKGRQRVLLLGDSTWFGHGVEDDETMEVLLQGMLRADGVDVEVINGGVPGYSTEQTRMLLDEVGWGLEPTLLLLGNLWSDNNFDHFRDADLLHTRREFLENPLAQSAIYQLLAGAIDGLRGGQAARVVTWTRSSQWSTVGQRRVPLQRYAENLDWMVREAASRGIGAAMLAPCNIEMARGTIPDDVVWAPYFDAQRTIATAHGIPVIEIAPVVVPAAAQGVPEALYIDEMHPSVAGHKLFAQAIYAGLQAAGWPGVSLVATGGPVDVSGLQDAPTEGANVAVNDLSPQTNLFPNAGPEPWHAAAERDEAARVARQVALEAEAAGKAPEETVAAAEAAKQDWWVTGKVNAPAGPVHVELRGEDGAVHSSAVLAAGGDFRLKVRAGTLKATVVLVGPQGETQTVTTLPGARPLTLDLGAPSPPASP